MDNKLTRGMKYKVFASGTILVGISLVGATPERTVHSKISNQELQTRVMRLVNSIRNLVHGYKSEDGELLAAFDKRDRSDISSSEKKAVRDQWIKESNATHDSFIRQYKQKYWSDAIVFRNELLRRLPKNFAQPQLSGIYQYPTNILGVEAIADNLELLAKSLPD